MSLHNYHKFAKEDMVQAPSDEQTPLPYYTLNKPPNMPSNTQDAHNPKETAPPQTSKRQSEDSARVSSLVPTDPAMVSPTQPTTPIKNAKFDDIADMDMKKQTATEKEHPPRLARARLSLSCKTATAQKLNGATPPGARTDGTPTRASPFAAPNMTYKTMVAGKAALPLKFVASINQFLILTILVASSTSPAVGIRAGVGAAFSAIKDATPAEIALMAKDRKYPPITNKAMLPKNHAEMRF